MQFRFAFLMSTFFLVRSLSAQEVYNNCLSALEICPSQSYSVNNIGANAITCAGCEDAFAFCFAPQNTIWLRFLTNAMGGDIQVDFTNLVFESNVGQDNQLQATVVQATSPCDGSTYTALGNCVSNAGGNFTLNALGLLPSTTYYIVIDGDNTGLGITSPAECTFDVAISGTGIDRLAPAVSISAPLTPLCLFETATFTATTSNCPDNGDFDWFINGALVATTTTPVFQTSALEQGDVVSVQTSCYLLCAQTTIGTSAALTVLSFPIDAGPDQTIQAGNSAVLGGSTTAPTFQWTPTFSMSNSTVLNPVVTPTQTTTYTLTATQNGCTLTDQATITIESTIDIPNSFSPNDDGTNDTWIIKGAELFPDASMAIYSRWGNEVFRSRGYSAVKAWKGTDDKGQPMADGVYFYVYELNDAEKQSFKGSVTVIR